MAELEICRVLIKANIPEQPKVITLAIEQEYWAAGERGDLDRCREIIEVYGVQWQCRYKTERCAGCPAPHNNQPVMTEELKPYEDEVNAAIKNKDMAGLRKIVEKAGLTWVDDGPNEKYMFDKYDRPEGEAPVIWPSL